MCYCVSVSASPRLSLMPVKPSRTYSVFYLRLLPLSRCVAGTRRCLSISVFVIVSLTTSGMFNPIGPQVQHLGALDWMSGCLQNNRFLHRMRIFKLTGWWVRKGSCNGAPHTPFFSCTNHKSRITYLMARWSSAPHTAPAWSPQLNLTKPITAGIADKLYRAEWCALSGERWQKQWMYFHGYFLKTKMTKKNTNDTLLSFSQAVSHASLFCLSRHWGFADLLPSQKDEASILFLWTYIKDLQSVRQM